MTIKFTNHAFSTLASGITNTATSLALATGGGALFPTLGVSDYFYATLLNSGSAREVIKVTAVSGDSLTIVRAQEGTTALAWVTGDRLELHVTAQGLTDIISSISSQITNALVNTTLTGTTSIPSTATGYTQTAGDTSTAIATDAFVMSAITTLKTTTNSVPTGAVTMWGGSPAGPPTGWLTCGGQAVSRTTYAALFAVIGTTFGAGDGVSTFNMPNLYNNFPVGAGSTYLAGSTGGATTATLTVAQLPAHNHPIVDPGHNHTYNMYSSQTLNANTGTYLWSGTVSTNTSTATTGVTVGNTGSGTAVPTLPPYLAIAFIIKT